MADHDKRAKIKARRRFLKGVGATAVAGLIPVGATAADEDNELTFTEKVRKADNLLHKEGEDARTEFLNGSGIEQTAISRGKFSVERLNGDSGPSPDRVDCIDPTQCEGDIDLSLSLNFNPYRGKYVVNATVSLYYVNWEGPYVGTYKGGEKPEDGLGFHWPRDEWKIDDRENIPGSTLGDDNISWDNGSWNEKGLAFGVDDKAMCTNVTDRDGDWSDTEFATAYVQLGDNHKPDSPIYATYLHTWSGSSYGFSVGFPPSISLSGSSSAESKSLQTTLNGDTLLVSEEDL